MSPPKCTQDFKFHRNRFPLLRSARECRRGTPEWRGGHLAHSTSGSRGVWGAGIGIWGESLVNGTEHAFPDRREGSAARWDPGSGGGCKRRENTPGGCSGGRRTSRRHPSPVWTHFLGMDDKKHAKGTWESMPKPRPPSPRPRLEKEYSTAHSRCS